MVGLSRGVDTGYFRDCLKQFARLLKDAQRNMSPREVVAFKAGLRAAHAEEALMAGDTLRAEAHLTSLLRFLRILRG